MIPNASDRIWRLGVGLKTRFEDPNGDLASILRIKIRSPTFYLGTRSLLVDTRVCSKSWKINFVNIICLRQADHGMGHFGDAVSAMDVSAMDFRSRLLLNFWTYAQCQPCSIALGKFLLLVVVFMAKVAKKLVRHPQKRLTWHLIVSIWDREKERIYS